MNIYTIAENLRNTIKGKEAYLNEIRQARSMASRDEDAALFATQSFLEINIDELKVILFDVEKACEQWNLMSWQVNPERMGQ